jgi:hypothetical protein
MEGMLLSLTVAGAAEAFHLFPEHLAAGAIIVDEISTDHETHAEPRVTT